jgi:phage gp46-like protein
MQQGDVLIFQTNDGGDISVNGGVVEMSGGLQTTAYLSLFGGNEDDVGGSDTSLTWWANLDETRPEREYRSETQNILQALTATPGNLRRVEDAANRDLAWLVEQKVAHTVTVSASMPGLNKIKLIINIDGDLTVEFLENWKARS